MKTTPYLIQRLRKPYPQNMPANPFVFGGGLLNGGFNKEAYALLRELWEYEYMGSAEFEFGAIPKSIQRIAEKTKEYSLFEITVTAKCKDYGEPSYVITKETATVYLLCKNSDKSEAEEWIHKLADGTKQACRTKEFVGLAESITKKRKQKRNVWMARH